jgi:hypothetical protein
MNGEIETGFIEENGARFVHNVLTKGQGMFFPQGSIHYQINTGCDPVLFVAALNNEDPGTNQIAQRCVFYSYLLLFHLLMLPLQSSGFPRTSFRPLSETSVFRKSPMLQAGYVFYAYISWETPLINVIQIPDSMAIGVDKCLQKCNLTRGNQTITQQQPRVAENALPLDTK